MIRFGRYQLDATQGLSRGEQEVRLTPKSLAVLWLLADRAGRVVTKDELFELVWPDTTVTDSALATCVQEIRHALDDDARDPRFVETVHRRGYRFVARTSRAAAEARSEPPSAGVAATLIGRDAQVDAILGALVDVRRGDRRICFVVGEAGIGKSAILEASLGRIAASSEVAVTRAQCIEQYGSGEPYLPVLDALMRLCRRPGGDRTVAVLERFAPMVLAQLPGLLTPRQLTALQRTLTGASRDRMLRELTNAVEAISADEPLVIGLEDLHWSDPSTLDWIAAVAPRRESAKLLIIATLRPTPPGEAEPPLRVLSDTLRTKGLATEIVLGGLDESSVARYVTDRLPPEPGREAGLERLARRLSHHTGGNPLFMGAVLDQLVERGVIVPVGERWSARDDAAEVDLGIPETVRPVLDRQVAALPAPERALLEAGSVVGDRFPSAVAAGIAGVDPVEAESTLDGPASRRFVHDVGAADALDGTASTELEFAHSLYREALYGGVPLSRRLDLHRRVGERLEEMWGERAAEIAGELAMHFERGRDPGRAVRYLQLAAENARRRSALREARGHYEHALGLVERLPESVERTERELGLRMGLGAVIMATSGFGAPEVEAAYSRARVLCQELGDTPRQFPALWGLWLFQWGRGDIQAAAGLAHELRGLADAADEDGLQLQALHASWATSFSEGAFADARAYAATGIDRYDAGRHAGMAVTYGSHDASVCARMFAARSLAFIGRIDEANEAGDAAVALGTALEHPFSLALALSFQAAVAQQCGDILAAGEHAREGARLAGDQGFGLPAAWCATIAGWAAARQGDAGGVRTVTDGIAAARKSVSEQFQPYMHGLLADACLATGRYGPAMAAIREAKRLATSTGERFYEAELSRLEGELIQVAGGDPAEAETAFLRAIDLARGQGATLLVLRSATSLGRLTVRRDGAERALGPLRAARAAFPLNLSSPDLVAADELLQGT